MCVPPPPQNDRMSLAKAPFQKELFIFQPSKFQNIYIYVRFQREFFGGYEPSWSLNPSKIFHGTESQRTLPNGSCYCRAMRFSGFWFRGPFSSVGPDRWRFPWTETKPPPRSATVPPSKESPKIRSYNSWVPVALRWGVHPPTPWGLRVPVGVGPLPRMQTSEVARSSMPWSLWAFGNWHCKFLPF